MRYKVLPAFIACFIVMVTMYSSCKKETAQTTTWASLKFNGSYTGVCNCLLAGNQSSVVSITALNDSEVSVSNLYGSGKSQVGMISGDSCIVAPQIYTTDSGNALLQGTLFLNADTLIMAIMVSSFSRQDKCTGILIKH